MLSIVVSIALLTALFAGIFKFLPATPVAWRDVKFGAFLTAILFEAGKFLIGMYLGSSTAVTSLGAAGALLALLFWVYYSAQIFLFGAALTRARAEAAGHVKPKHGAIPRSPPAPVGARKPAPASALSLVVLLVARAVALIIVDRWERRGDTRRARSR